jgi:hypothetical protein
MYRKLQCTYKSTLTLANGSPYELPLRHPICNLKYPVTYYQKKKNPFATFCNLLALECLNVFGKNS